MLRRMASPPTIEAARVIQCGLTMSISRQTSTARRLSLEWRSRPMARRLSRPPTIIACGSGASQPADAKDGSRVTPIGCGRLSMSPDGHMLASGCERSHRMHVGHGDGQPADRLPAMDHVVAIRRSFHPNNQQLAVTGFCDTVEIVNTSSGQVVQQMNCPSLDERTISFSPNGQRMAVAGAMARFGFGT